MEHATSLVQEEDCHGNDDAAVLLSLPLLDTHFLYALCHSQVVESFFAKKGFVGPLYESYDSRLDNILTLLDRYDKEPPFTVQRLAELLIHADEEYRTTHALMYGLSKILSVHTLVSDYEDHLDSFIHEESLFI